MQVRLLPLAALVVASCLAGHKAERRLRKSCCWWPPSSSSSMDKDAHTLQSGEPAAAWRRTFHCRSADISWYPDKELNSVSSFHIYVIPIRHSIVKRVTWTLCSQYLNISLSHCCCSIPSTVAEACWFLPCAFFSCIRVEPKKRYVRKLTKELQQSYKLNI